jgi:hypothetical protein
MAFGTKIGNVRSVRGCTCWDCLREQGITPPEFQRDKFPRLYPRRVMVGSSPPVEQKSGAQKDEKYKATAEEKASLKDAIRNREVI